MNKSKTEKLEILFNEWQIKQENESDDSFVNHTKGDAIYITKGHFCKDGIICEEKFENEKIKVLFISNEANDDSYSAKNSKITSRIESFNEYYNNKDVERGWGGKLRERICALYKVIIENYEIPENKVSQNFAFMNLNKRGGKNTIRDKNIGRNHIEEYVDLYKDEIKKEIQIINPDIIVWLGVNTYNMNLHIKYLDAYIDDGKVYIDINDKKVPILKMYHTSRGRWLSCEPDSNFSNKILGRLATEMKNELKRYGLRK